jgi:preprotein translocase subunit SecF
MQVNSVKHGKSWFIFSGILTAVSLTCMLISTIQLGSPVRLGLDFTGGSRLEYQFDNKSVSSEEVNHILNDVGLLNSLATVAKGDKPILIIRTQAISDDPALDKLNEKLTEKYGKFEISSLDTVNPLVGPELLQGGLVALFFTMIAISLYISSRFKRDYAIAAITALFHDVIVLIGLFAFLGLQYGIEVDSLFITAVLTTFGFSVHDTIVVFDRIRENQKLQTSKFKFHDVANLSVNQVSGRSLNTSLATLTTLATLFFFGGSSTQLFVGALFIGLAVGTYSSIFLASPLLVWLRENTKV